MKTPTTRNTDLQVLMREVRRYLAAVEAFRAEGHEPCWRREWTSDDDAEIPRRREVVGAPPIP